MSNSARSAVPGRLLLTLLGVAVSAGLLGFALVRLDWPAVLGALARAELMPWLPAAALAYLAGHVVRGVRCRLLLRDTGVSHWTATHFVVIGYAANNVLPARGGELVRAGMISERTGLRLPSALAVTLVERLLDGLAIIALMFAGVVATDLPRRLPWTVWLILAAFAGGLSVVALLVAYPDVFRARIARLSVGLGPRVQAWLVRVVGYVTAGVAVLGQPGVAWRVSLLSLAVWTLEAGMYWALLPALGLPAAPSWAFVVMGVTNLGLLVPSTPGFVGTFHAFVIATLGALGVGLVPATAYAVLVHATFYLPITVWGLAALLVYGVEFARLRALTRAAWVTPAAADTAGGVPGAVVVERLPAIGGRRPPRRASLLETVVRALLADSAERLEHLASGERQRVVGDVVEFVSAQVQALPHRLRLLFGLGLTLFGVIVRLRHPRGLAALPEPRQAAVVQAWAFGRLGAPRKLFRLIRSTALLAFYDHPLVAPALSVSERRAANVVRLDRPNRVSP